MDEQAKLLRPIVVRLLLGALGLAIGWFLLTVVLAPSSARADETPPSGGVVGVAQSLVGTVTGALAPLAPPVTGPVTDVLDQTVDTVTDAVSDIATSSPVSSVTAPVTDTVQDVVSTVNDIPVVGDVLDGLHIGDVVSGTVGIVGETTQAVDGAVGTVVAGTPPPGAGAAPLPPEGSAPASAAVDIPSPSTELAIEVSAPTEFPAPQVGTLAPSSRGGSAPHAGTPGPSAPAPADRTPESPDPELPGIPGSGSSSSASQTPPAGGTAALAWPITTLQAPGSTTPASHDDSLPSSPVFETDTSPD